MPEWLLTIIHGVVEGITEFLPISSTGHLILVQYFLDDARSELFNVGIQSGAVSAVVLIYWRKLYDLTIHFNQAEQRGYILKLVLAFAVTVVLGLTVRKLGFTLPEEPVPIAWAVFLGAILIFISEWRLTRCTPSEHLGWSVVALVGVAQVIAGVFPGTSRSAATIIMAMLLGVSRMRSTEFSFLLGIPTMFAAGFYLALESWQEEGAAAFQEMDQFWLGFFVSAVVAFIAVKWLLGFIRTHSFNPFAWYRLALGLFLLWWFYRSPA
ncbi:MAG: undecaprenyl-diphosphate phosphatase [Verrucomicrobiota bacterium]